MPGLFYVDALPGSGELAVVDGDDGFHAATVRRIRVGEELILGDGAGTVARCVVEETARDGLRARVLSRRQVAPAQPPVTVVQALPKSERSELAVELATEAGADALVAWQAARCVARWDGARADKGLRRWRAVARAAAQQSRRAYIPAVDGVLSTAALVARIGEVRSTGGVVLALHESADGPLADLSLAHATSVMVRGRPRRRHRSRRTGGDRRRRRERRPAGTDRAAHLDRGRRRAGRVGCADPAVGRAVQRLTIGPARPPAVDSRPLTRRTDRRKQALDPT